MRCPGGLISEDEEYFNTGPVAELTTWRKISTECNEVHFLCISDTITSSLWFECSIYSIIRWFYTKRNVSGMSRRYRCFLLLHMRRSFFADITLKFDFAEKQKLFQLFRSEQETYLSQQISFHETPSHDSWPR